MKYLTAIICAAIVGGALIYHARTRPGRYYFPNTWSNMRMGDTATGKIYCTDKEGSFSKYYTFDPVKSAFEWPWE